MSIQKKDIKDLFNEILNEYSYSDQHRELTSFIKSIRVEGRPERNVDLKNSRTPAYKAYIRDLKEYNSLIGTPDADSNHLLEKYNVDSLEKVFDLLQADPSSETYRKFLSELARKKYRSPKFVELSNLWKERVKLQADLARITREGKSIPDEIQSRLRDIDGVEHMARFIEYKISKADGHRLSPSVIEHLTKLSGIIVSNLTEAALNRCARDDDKIVDPSKHLFTTDLVGYQSYPVFANTIPYKKLDNREKRKLEYYSETKFIKVISKTINQASSFEDKEAGNGHCLKTVTKVSKKSSSYFVTTYKWFGLDEDLDEDLAHVLSAINTQISDIKHEIASPLKVSKTFKTFVARTVISFINNIFHKFLVSGKKTLNAKELNKIIGCQIIDYGQEADGVARSIYPALLASRDQVE